MAIMPSLGMEDDEEVVKYEEKSCSFGDRLRVATDDDDVEVTDCCCDLTLL